MRKLNFIETLAVCIGAIVGTGIFYVPGIVASILGYGSIVLWILMIVISVVMGLCFADLASMFKKGGGPIIFVKSAFGDFSGFIAGWLTWLISAVAVAGISLSISYYISFFIPLTLVERILISLALLIIFTTINYFGIKLGARIELFLTSIIVILLILFIGWGSFTFDVEKFRELTLDLAGLGPAMVFALEIFVGWETITIISEEVGNSRKIIPKVLLYTILISGAIYFFVILMFLGNINLTEIEESFNPLATAANNIGGVFAGSLFGITAILVGLSALNSWILSTSRLPYEMAKQKLFLRSFKHKSSFDTPDRALFLQLFLASIIVIEGSLEGVISLFISVSLFLYLLCFASLYKLRHRKRGFKLNVLFPITATIFGIIILSYVPLELLTFSLVLILFGIPSYISIKLVTNSKFVEKFFDRMYVLYDLYLPLALYRKHEMERVIRLADLERGQTVLDYGCGAGHMTMKIADAVSPGKVVALDISEKQLKYALRKNIEKIESSNTMFVKMTKGFKIPKKTFDRIICSVSINYFIHPEKELKQLSKVLKKDGKAVFLAIKAPSFPMVNFLRHDYSIINAFNHAGFKKIDIYKTKKLAREYIYITARK